MPIPPNTEFENKLASSNFGQTPNLASTQNVAKTAAEMSADELLQLVSSQARQVSKPVPNPFAPLQVSPNALDMSGRYPKQLVGWDNEDIYGSMQSNWNKAANGTLKALNLATTTFLQGTVGLVYGLGNVIAGNGLNSFYNNDLSQSIEKWNKSTENSLPNYYTNKETNAAWYSPDNLFTANFLFDKLIKNAGFSIGALYSGGIVSKAISTAMKGVGLFSEANQALKVTQALEEALPATAQAGRFSKFQEIISSSLPKLSPTQVDRTITSFLGAATEGGIEALQGLNEYRDLKLQEFQTSNGRTPNEAEMKEINSQSASVGNARFFFNIGLLSATNYIQLPKILGSRYSTSKALANTEAATLGEAGAIKRTADRTFAKATGNNFLEKAYNRTGAVTKYFWAPMEAFEEGAQFVIEKGTKDYYTKKYGGQGADFISSLQEGVSQLSSKEGMESIVLGGLSGGLQQIRGNIKGMGQERQATGALLSSLNSTQEALKEIKSDKWLNDMKDATARGINLMQENAQQVADGNILEAKDLEADLMHNYLAARIKNGRYDLVKEDIAHLRQQGSTQEGLEKLITQGYADQSDTIQTFQKRLSNFEVHADNLKPTFEALNLKYGGLYVNSPTGERKRQYPEAIIDQMAYAVSKVADYDQRIPELSQQLIAKGVEVQGIIDSPETVKEALSHIDNLQINVDQKETLKRSLSDVLTMSKRRQQFLKAYDDIAANPDGYEETSPTPSSTPETVKIKTKDGDEDIVVGEEYYLGKVIEHDKDGHEVYRFPKLTILGENEDGTIKIRTSSGEIKDVAKSVLEDYKLGKVADLQNNKKAKFYFDHINDTFEFNFGKGKKQIGRLQYSQKDHILLFTYRKNGKTKSIEVTGDQFIPKEGYQQPMIKKVGTLTVAQEQSLKEFSEEKDTRQQAKRAARLSIIENLVDETGKRMGDVASMLQNRYNDFEKVTEELSKLEQKIKAGELTKKNNFKASTNRAIKAANKLSRLQNELKLEIEKLETERDELEFNLEYFHDLASNIDELPTDSKDFIEEINNQALDLELLIEETGKSITQISSLIDKVSDALDSAIDWLRENIRLFKNVYPKAPLSLDNDEFNAFLEANPNFLKLRPEYINDLRQLEDLVSQVEDLDIKPNERTLHELNQHLEETLEKIKELEKQYKAKEAIIEKFAQVAKEYKEQKIAEAIARQNVELQAQFFNKLKQIEGESGIETTSPEEQEESETEFIKKKEAAKRNIATISGTINPEEADKIDSNKRHEQFLSQVDLFPNRGQILQTFVTANNEEAFGLKGIISTYLGTHVPEEGGELILALYVEQDTTGQYFVGVDGKRLKNTEGKDIKVGESVDQNLIVFGPMTSDRMFSKKYGDRYSGADQEELLQWQKLWKKKRDEILALKGKSYTVEFKTSRGIPIIDRDAENRPTGKKFPILSNLVSEQQLNDGKRLLVVSTIGTIEHQGRNVKIPVGRVMIQNGSTLEYANNRNLTEKEALATFAVLKDFVKKANNKEGFNPKYVQFLQGMLFFSSPYTRDKETGEYIKQEKPVARNQFYFHKGDFYFGEKEFPIPFTSESMEANKASILAFLTGAYNHVNERTLKNNRTFIEFNEQLEEKHWPTYQHFLLSKEGRSEEEVPLSTIVRPISPLVPNDRNFNNKYSYAPSLFTQEELPTKKPVEQAPQQAQTEDISNTGDSILKGLGYKNHNRQTNGNVKGGQSGWKIRFNIKNPKTGESYYSDNGDTRDEDYFLSGKKIVDFLISYFGNGTTNTSTQQKIEGFPVLEGHYKAEENGKAYEPFKHLAGGELGESDFTIYIGSADDVLKFISDVRTKHPEILSLLHPGNQSSDVKIDDIFKGRIEGRKLGFSGYHVPTDLNNLLGKEHFTFIFDNKRVSINYKGNSLTDISVVVEGGNAEGVTWGYKGAFDKQLQKDFPELYKNIRNIIGFQMYGEYLKGSNDEFLKFTGVSKENAKFQARHQVGTKLAPSQQAPVNTVGMSNFERLAAYLAETANAPEAPKDNVGGFNLANFQTKQGEETAGNNAVIPMDAVLAAKAPNTVEIAPEMDEATKMELERIAGNKASKEEPQNRLVGAYNYTLADVEKELKELERISPLPIKTIKSLIAAGNGLFSFGQYMNGLILLSEQMEEGTGYHELFHGIFDAFLNKKEKDSIYKEFSQRKGTFVERITGDVIAYKDATIGQANEQMAEEFREFKLDGLLPDNISTNGGIIKFFQDLFKWIASMFTGDVHSLNKLFSRIDAAYYKNVPFKSIPSSSPQSRIKIGSLTSLDTQSVIKGIVGAVFQKLTEVGGKYQNYKLLNDLDFGEKIPKEIYDDIRNDLKDFYQTTWYEKLKEEGMSDEANFNKRAPVINSIFPNWAAFVQASGEFLKTFKILQEQEQDKEGEDSKHDNREDSYLREAFEYDGKKNAPATIKLFLGTIQESEFVNKLEATTPGEAFTPRAIVAKRDEATGMPIMLDYSNVYNDIMYNLMNYNTLEEKEQRIIELSKTRPEYVRIYNRLKIGRENLSMAEWDFKTKFYNTFAKQSPIALNTYIGDDGSTHIGAAELDSPIKQLSNNWLQTLKDSPAVSFDPVKKTYILDTNHSTNSGATFPKHISPFLFLKTWGIDFTKEQIARINSDQLAKLERAIATFKTIVTGKKDISSLQKLGVKAPLDTIFSIYLQSENLVPNSVFTNLEGNNRQSVVGTNAFSREINDINNSPTRKKLLEQLPHLQLPFSKDSWYVNEGWFNAEGNSLKQKLSTSYNQGIVTPNQDRNIPTEKLTEAKRLAHAINQNLRENYYFLLPGDSQTEWAIKLKNRFRSLTQEALDQFYSYYQTEQQLGGSKGRVFNFLAKEDKTGKEITLSKEEFIKQYTAFFNKEVEKQFQQLLENNIIQQEVDEKYTWKGLDGDFAEEFKFSPKFLTIGQINDILTYRTINFQFNNIEIYKVFFGDPKEFGKKDSKRWKTFGSPREQSLYDSSELNEIANKEYNNVNGIELKQGDPGYLFWTDELKTVSTQDVFSLDTLPGYDDKTNPINGTDGGAVATLVSARQIMKKNARLDSRQEALIDYALAEDRLLMEKDGEYIYTSKALRQHDERLTASPLDNGAKISPAKPVVSGFTEDGPILDKYSIAFITYKAVRGTNWAKQYKRMLKENISYMIYESGRKVGAKELDSIYNADGSPNTATFLPNSIINVPFKWFGIQVETGGDTTSQTWGSQTGKIITSNLLNAGVPIDYEGTYDEWNALPEEERSTPIYSLVKQERQLREAMIEQGYKQLLEKVGINKDGTVSKKRLLSLIKDELTRRELNDNIKEALEINEDTKDFLIPLEALNNYEQIKNVIFSYVSKYISSPKVGGGSKIMVSGSGWEVAGHRIVKHFNKTTGKAIFTSAGLHNYTKEEPWTGILIGNWFAEKLRNIPALNGKTDKDIFDYVNNSPDGKKILNGVGFRIPTQELNSIENFKIEGFLPQEFRGMVVVAESITKKSGGDFDVDKLNTYLKNVYINGNGELMLIPYLGEGEEAIQAFRTIVDKETIQKMMNITYLDKHFNTELKPTSAETEQLSVEELERWEEQRMEDAKNDEDLAQIMYKKSLENEYFATVSNIITLEENFSRLISPNHSKNLKDLRDLLVKISEEEFGQGAIKSVLSPTYMNTLRHMYISGKSLVGIPASAQVQNAVAQKTAVVISPSKISQLKDDNEKTYIGDGAINLPHNTVKIGGKLFSTISNAKDQVGRYISEKISQFINGFVDITEDPFLVQLGVNRNNAGVYILLERLGVPTPTTILFMNQPIIREYQKMLERNDKSYPFIDISEDKTYGIEVIRSQFHAGGQTGQEQMFPKKGLDSLLEKNIEDYYNGELTMDQNDFQQFVLSEWLKYSVIASNLFRLSQATNYDTTKFSNPYLYLRKKLQQKYANSNNVFSSADGVMESVFVGKLADRIGDAITKISDSFFKFLHSDITPYVFPTMYQLAERKKMNDQDFLKASRKVEQAFISYLIQNTVGRDGRPINEDITSLLLNEETSAAALLNKLKREFNNQPNNPFKILDRFIGTDKHSPTAAKTIRIFNKPRSAFEQNVFIGAMEELRDNPKTKELYGKLLRVAFLQSGIAQTPYSFSEIIPVEDFKHFVFPAIKNLYNKKLLEGFQATDTFYKNSWRDPNIVPRNAVTYKYDDFGNRRVKNRLGSSENEQEIKASNALYAYAQAKGINNFQAYKVSTKATNFSSDYITMQLGTKEQPALYLMKKLYDSNNQPVLRAYSKSFPDNKYAIYYSINPLGDGYKGQEHYTSKRPSVFKDTEAVTMEAELSPQEIIEALDGKQLPEAAPKTEEQKVQDKLNDCLGK